MQLIERIEPGATPAVALVELAKRVRQYFEACDAHERSVVMGADFIGTGLARDNIAQHLRWVVTS